LGWRGIFRILGRGDHLEVFTLITILGAKIGPETEVSDFGNTQVNHVNVITGEVLWT